MISIGKILFFKFVFAINACNKSQAFYKKNKHCSNKSNVKAGLFMLTLIIIFTLVANNALSQCYTTNTTFKAGERLKYNVWYNWGLIWVHAGEALFLTDSVSYKNNPAYLIKSYGNSLKSWDWVFKVRDYYQVYLQPDPLKPLEFTRQNYEGGYVVNNNYVFDYNKNLIYSRTENSKKPLSIDTLKITACVHDLLSAIIYTRNYDYSNLEINQIVPIKTIIDAEFFPLYIRYLGKETISDRDKNKYNCLKFSIMLVEGTMFNAGENMTVWVSDDKNKIPILIEAKILVGSVKAYLTDYSKLRHPFKSKVD